MIKQFLFSFIKIDLNRSQQKKEKGNENQRDDDPHHVRLGTNNSDSANDRDDDNKDRSDDALSIFYSDWVVIEFKFHVSGFGAVNNELTDRPGIAPKIFKMRSGQHEKIRFGDLIACPF